MGSCMGYQWHKVAPRGDLRHPSAAVTALGQAWGMTQEILEETLAPRLKTSLRDPFELADMEKATVLLGRAIEEGRRILLFGDYDVDGMVSIALLYRFLKSLGIEAAIRTADRFQDGYGLNSRVVGEAAAAGFDVLVVLDCGTHSLEEIAQARAAGLKTIVIDHHQAGPENPAADGFINPKRADPQTFTQPLCTAGLTYLFLIALRRFLKQAGGRKPLPDLLDMLDLVALATLCDMVPLRQINRSFVVQGLKNLQNTGLRVFLQQEKQPALRPHLLNMKLGPYLNAASRMGETQKALAFLLCDEAPRLQNLLPILRELNNKRQAVEVACMQQIASRPTAQQGALFVWDPQWHEGIVGLLAGRLNEQTDRPAFVATKRGGLWVGSARGRRGCSISQILSEARRQGLILKGGGHTQAGGFSLEEAQLIPFGHFLQQLHIAAEETQKIHTRPYVAVLGQQAGDIYGFFEAQKHFLPFGVGFEAPRYVLKGVMGRAFRAFGRHQDHFSGQLIKKELQIRGVLFRSTDHPIRPFLKRHEGGYFDVLGRLSTEGPKPEFLIEDVRAAEDLR